MLARTMRIERILIPIHFPQGKHVGLFLASPDLVLNHSRLFDRRVAQLPKKRFRFVRISRSECELDSVDYRALAPGGFSSVLRTPQLSPRLAQRSEARANLL